MPDDMITHGSVETSTDFQREIRTRAFLARSRERDVSVTVQTMRAAGMPLLRGQQLVLRERALRFASLAARLEALDRRFGRVDDEGVEDEVTRQDSEWLSLSRLSTFRELDEETERDLREQAEMDAAMAGFGGAR